MRRSSKVGLGLNVGVLVVAAVAIGVVPVSTASPGGRGADFRRAGNDGVKEYPSLGLVSRPAPEALKVRVAVDAKAAVDRTRNSVLGPAMTPGAPQVELRLISTRREGHGESLNQDLSGVLEWVVTYGGTRPTVHGPLYLDPQVRAAAMSLECDMVFFVDAATAELLHGALQEC